MCSVSAYQQGNKKNVFTYAYRQAVTPKTSGGANQHLGAVQGKALFTSENTLRAKAEVPQRMGAVHRQA